MNSPKNISTTKAKVDITIFLTSQRINATDEYSSWAYTMTVKNDAGEETWHWLAPDEIPAILLLYGVQMA